MPNDQAKVNFLRVDGQFTGTRRTLDPLSAAKLNSNLRKAYCAGRTNGAKFKCWIQARTIRVWRTSYQGQDSDPDKTHTRYVLGTTRSDVEAPHKQWCHRHGYTSTTMEQQDNHEYLFEGDLKGQTIRFAAKGAKAALERWAHHCDEWGEDENPLRVVRRITANNPFPEEQ